MQIKRTDGEETVIDGITVQVYQDMLGNCNFSLKRVGCNWTWCYSPETLIKIANWLQMK